MKFEWDEKKNKANLKKHKISFEMAVYVFSDEEAITIFDEEHSSDENRWVTIGRIKNSNIIVVIHTERIRKNYEYIRIISARKADKEETNFYFESIGKKEL
jgi:uncharacterized protein